jgi:hypothetical protein
MTDASTPGSVDLDIVKTAASLCRATYAYSGDIPTVWDHWDDGADDGVVWGAKKVNGVWYAAMRGSVKLPDWIHDAEAIAVYCAALAAHVHPGFNWGMEKVAGEIEAIVRVDPWFSIGHSLGASRADNAAAYAIKRGFAPVARVVFGEPKPGFSDFCSLVGQIPAASFINLNDEGRDRVPAVPVDLPDEPYGRPSPLLPLRVQPPPFDGVDLFRFHHMVLYDPAARALTALPPPIPG